MLRSAANCSSVKPPGCFVVQLDRVDRAVDERQRQRDIIRDALGAQILDDREALAPGIVDACPNLQPLLEHDHQRAGVEIRRVQNIEIDRAQLDLGARLPDEIAAVNLGMQSSNEDADTPQRQARPQPSVRSISAINLLGLVADLAPSISQSVNFLQFSSIHDAGICRASSTRVKASTNA